MEEEEEEEEEYEEEEWRERERAQDGGANVNQLWKPDTSRVG